MKHVYAKGMQLERYIEMTCEQYKKDKVAVIDKIATPVKIMRVMSDGRVRGKLEKKSTVDFIGISNGEYIAFDAKETATKRLPLEKIKPHQLEYLGKVKEQGGRAFLIVSFTSLDRYFKMDIERIMIYKNACVAQSIPLTYFEAHAKEIKFNEQGYILDYLEIKG